LRDSYDVGVELISRWIIGSYKIWKSYCTR